MGWAVLKGLRISDTDRELLAASLSVGHPSELGEMAKAIEPGVTVVVVEQIYGLDTNDPAQRVDCAACHRTKNHWRGFVVRLSNGNLTTIGRTCGTTKHALEYREQIAEFTARLKRRRSLEQLLADFRHYDEFTRISGTCLNSNLLKQLQSIRGIFGQRFPPLTRALIKHPDGVLYGKVLEHDYDAEQQRDSRRDAKISNLARQWGVSPDDPAQQGRLRAAFAGDPDFSRERMSKTIRKQTAQYRGAAFVTLLDTLRASAVDLKHRVTHVLDSVDDKETDTLTRAQMISTVSRFSAVLHDLIVWHNTIQDGAAFFDPANLREIGQWVRRSKARRETIGDIDINLGTLSIGSAQMPLPNLPAVSEVPSELNRLLFNVTGQRWRT